MNDFPFHRVVRLRLMSSKASDFHAKSVNFPTMKKEEEIKNIKNFSISNEGKQIYHRFVNGLHEIKAQEG